MSTELTPEKRTVVFTAGTRFFSFLTLHFLVHLASLFILQLLDLSFLVGQLELLFLDFLQFALLFLDLLSVADELVFI